MFNNYKKNKPKNLPKYDRGGEGRASVDNTRTMYGGSEDASTGSSIGNTESGTQNIYNEKRGSNISAGQINQYAQMGQAVAQGGMQAYQTSQTPGLSEYEKNQQYGESIKSAEQGVVSAINPIFGMIHSGVTAATAPLTAKATQTDEQGNLKNKNFAKADIIGQGFADPMAMIPTMISNKFSMKKYINSVEDNAKGKIAAQKAQEDAYAQQQAAYQQQQNDYINNAIQAGMASYQNQPQGTSIKYPHGGMNNIPNTIPQYPTGGTMPRLKPRNFAAEKANYEEATRGANQGDGSGISSAELAYKYSKLIDPTGATSAVEIGKNFYTGNPQDPIDYLGLIRIPFVKQGMKPLSKLAKQGNKASVLNNIITKSNDVAESFSYGGVSQSDVIHAPEMGGYFRKNGGIQYSNGGMSMQPNAEVEGGGYGKDGENTLNPDGTATQFNGPTHEQGGIKTNLDPGTLIFSDKVKWDGKTAADHNKPYTRIIQKATKDLENSSLTKESKLSAHLNLMAATKASQAIFAKQEETKQSRIDSYTKRLGGIMKYPNGGITPQQYKQAQSDSLTLYNSGLKSNIPNFEQNNNYTDAFLRLNDLNKRPPVPTNNVDPYSRTTTATYIKPTMLPYREENFKKGSGIEKIENYAKPVGKPVNHPNYNQFIPGINQSKQPIQTEEFKKGGVKLPKYGNGVKFVPKMASEDQDADIVVPGTRPASKDFTDVLAPDPYNTFGKPLDNWEAARLNKSAWDADYMNNPSAPNPNVTNPDSKNFDWKGLATQSAYFAANNAGNIYDLARADKTETRKYNRATENLVTPNFRDADQKYLYMKNALKGASLGASGYLANLQQSHVNHVLNKAQIQQAADNTNAGIKNQVSQYNTGIANEEILANAKIRANARNIKQSAIASIGSNTANQMNDVRNTNMDKKKMEGLIKMYPSLSKDPKMLEYFMSFNA